MLLALDIGNSTLAAAIFDRHTMRGEMRVSSTVQRTPDETWHVLENFLRESGTSPEDIKGVGISSVVPFLTDLLADLSERKLSCTALVITGNLDLGIRINYRDRMQLGSDRICSAVAGFHHYGGPLIVIDFGTATTYGVLDANGDILGGAIALGVKTTAESLHSRTAQLPKIDLTLPSTPLGTDTISAMQAGTMFGAIDAVEGMIARLKDEIGTDAKVVATGGLSGIMAPLVPLITHHHPFLVLEGIPLIYERVRAIP